MSTALIIFMIVWAAAGFGAWFTADDVSTTSAGLNAVAWLFMLAAAALALFLITP
jgi:hypothetical protein